jgi:hypothetical protein
VSPNRVGQDLNADIRPQSHFQQVVDLVAHYLPAADHFAERGLVDDGP